MKRYLILGDEYDSWIKVDLSEVEDLGIANKISRYSRVHRNKAYLDMEVDYPVLKKAKEENGEEIEVRYRFTPHAERIYHFNEFVPV